MALRIKYKGKTIATAQNGQTVEVDSKGHKFTENMFVESYGGGGAGSAEFNIAYGDTEPADTSKLWVKTSEPNSVKISADFDGVMQIENISSYTTSATDVGVAKVGKKFYRFGGKISNSYSNEISVVDLEANTSTVLSTVIPVKVQDIAAAAVGTKIYLFGGYLFRNGVSNEYNTKIFVFDTETETINMLSTVLPLEVAEMNAAVVDDKIYLFGGCGGSKGNGYNADVFVFNSTSNGIGKIAVVDDFTRRVPLVVGTKIFLIGGYHYSSVESNKYSHSVKMFDTKTLSVTTFSAKLPESLTYTYDIGTMAVGTKIYLFCENRKVYIFDIETDTITEEPNLASSALYIGTFTDGVKTYLCTNNSIIAYQIVSPLLEGEMLIKPSETENFCNLIDSDGVQMKIGVNSVYLGNSEGYAEKVPAALYKDGAWVEI